MWQHIEFNGPNQELEKGPLFAPCLPPHPAFGIGIGAKAFEVRVSSDISARALAASEQEMMKRWIK